MNMIKKRREGCETRSDENRREMRSSEEMNVEVLSHIKINQLSPHPALAKAPICSELRGWSPSVDSRGK